MKFTTTKMNSDRAQNYSQHFRNQKGASRKLVLTMLQVDMATRKFVQTISAVLPAVLCSKRLPFLRTCEQYTHKYSTYRVAQHDRISSREHAWLKLKDCTSLSIEQLSSTCHVSFFAAPDSDHKHKFSLTHVIHFSCLIDGLTFTNKPYDLQPIFSFRCSMAEWRINANPVSYRS